MKQQCPLHRRKEVNTYDEGVIEGCKDVSNATCSPSRTDGPRVTFSSLGSLVFLFEDCNNKQILLSDNSLRNMNGSIYRTFPVLCSTCKTAWLDIKIPREAVGGMHYVTSGWLPWVSVNSGRSWLTGSKATELQDKLPADDLTLTA